MRFWDASALVALFVVQPGTERVLRLRSGDSTVIAWDLTEIEMHSAIQRLRREGTLRDEETDRILVAVAKFWESVQTIYMLDAVKARARRILATHPLRASDALQLGAAWVAADDDPRRIEFVCLDARLASTARREGFRVVP